MGECSNWQQAKIMDLLISESFHQNNQINFFEIFKIIASSKIYRIFDFGSSLHISWNKVD